RSWRARHEAVACPRNHRRERGCARQRDRGLAQPRCLLASYRSSAAATLTLSDSTLPAIGIETASSHVRRTSGRRPFPSAPKTRATPPLRSVSHIGLAPSPTAA